MCRAFITSINNGRGVSFSLLTSSSHGASLVFFASYSFSKKWGKIQPPQQHKACTDDNSSLETDFYGTSYSSLDDNFPSLDQTVSAGDSNDDDSFATTLLSFATSSVLSHQRKPPIISADDYSNLEIDFYGSHGSLPSIDDNSAAPSRDQTKSAGDSDEEDSFATLSSLAALSTIQLPHQHKASNISNNDKETDFCGRNRGSLRNIDENATSLDQTDSAGDSDDDDSFTTMSFSSGQHHSNVYLEFEEEEDTRTDSSMSSINSDALTQVKELKKKLKVQEYAKVELLQQCLKLHKKASTQPSFAAYLKSLKDDNRMLKDASARMELAFMNEMNDLVKKLATMEMELKCRDGKIAKLERQLNSA